jgi:hypothetical protein
MLSILRLLFSSLYSRSKSNILLRISHARKYMLHFEDYSRDNHEDSYDILRYADCGERPLNVR